MSGQINAVAVSIQAEARVLDERLILGTLLVDNEMAADLDGFWIQFELPEHDAIWLAWAALNAAGKVANPITVKFRLPNDMAVGDVPINYYLANLAGGAWPIDKQGFIEALRRSFVSADEQEIARPPSAGVCGDRKWIQGLGSLVEYLADNAELAVPKNTTSPIEGQFFAATFIWNMLLGSMCNLEICDNRCVTPACVFAIFPQEHVGRHRVDFVLLGQGRYQGVDIVVELDGHDWHYSDKRQIERDRARDRELQVAGYVICRFPGSQVFRDSIGCVVAVLETAEAILEAKSGGRGERADGDGGLSDFLSFRRARGWDKP